jgi:multidrug efflux pump subunit AcrA (membrane-fusion protein)
MNGEESTSNLGVSTVSDSKASDSVVAEQPPRPPRRWLVPLLIGLAIAGGLGWIIFNRFILPIMIASQMKPQPMPVAIANPRTGQIEDSSDYAANLDSRQSVTLQPRVGGQVSAIFVRPGDQVQAGQPLLQIDAAEQQAQVASRTAAAQTTAAEVDSALADVESANQTLRAVEAQRATAQANVQLNQREYERFQELERQGASTRQVVDQRLNALQTAQAALRQAEAEIQAQQAAIARAKSVVARNQRAVEQAQATIAEGQAQLQYYTIRAPFSGTIGDIPVKEGDTVGNTTQLLNLTQNQQLDIQLQVPLERAEALRPGLPVKLLGEQGQEIQTGRISFIAPNVDPSTQSVLTKARFENVKNFRSSQFVRARVVWQQKPGVLAPTSAISRLGGRDFLFVAAPFKDSGCQAPAQSQGGGKVEVTPDQLVAAQKPVKLGKIVGNDQEILEGLNAADRIVTSGILQLQNCMPIADGAAAQ